MPYQPGHRLPGERASKLGHLEVISSPLVKRICTNFEDANYEHEIKDTKWLQINSKESPAKIVFSVDGSIQFIEKKVPPYKALAFVKIALLRMDFNALERIDKKSPHPLAIRDLMKDSALFHATAFPLRHVSVSGETVHEAVRKIIYESVKDEGKDKSIDGAMMETLKWIAFEKWTGKPKAEIEPFGCPHCENNSATLKYDNEKGTCPKCGKEIYITDLFGLHFGITDDYAKDQVATDYMTIAETLMIFTPIRYYWENKKEVLKNCLLVKDGPLTLRATTSKLAAPIRRFFNYAKSQGFEVALLGQEKSGDFYEHLQLIGPKAPVNSLFMPNNDYIKNEIKHINSKDVYGKDTNYGAKIFLKLSDYHKMIINVPTGDERDFVLSPDIKKLIAFNKIYATLPKILSNRFEGALLPVELANGVASLSTYPSARALELFADAEKKK